MSQGPSPMSAVSGWGKKKHGLTDIFHSAMILTETELYMSAKRVENIPMRAPSAANHVVKPCEIFMFLEASFLWSGPFSRRNKRSVMFRRYVTANSSYLTPEQKKTPASFHLFLAVKLIDKSNQSRLFFRAQR